MALDEPALEDYKQNLSSADATLLDRLVDAQLAQGDMLPLSANNPNDIFTFSLTDNVATDSSYVGPRFSVETDNENHASYTAPHWKGWQL